jgi:rod shape-determining protein MreC
MLEGSPHRRARVGLRLAAFTIASLLMLLAARTEPALFVQQAAARALDPLRGAVAAIGEAATGMIGALGEIGRLRGDNDRLRSQLAGAEQRIAELREAAAENAELRLLLGLTTSLGMDLLPVRILTRDPSNYSWEIGIDAGTEDGVRVGMPVVGAADGGGALAGSVVAVSTDSATVRLVVDSRSRVVAMDQETRALGLVQGQLGGQLVMVQVAVTDQAEVGDSIVTAGLVLADPSTGSTVRSPYPSGLLIGTVQAIQRDANALTQTLFVRPSVDAGRIARLLVILDFTQE